MKELVYRNMLGNNPKKHEISLEESSVRMRVQVSKKRSCKYFIKDSFTSDDKEKLRYWIEMGKLLGCRKECHILRCADSRTGENKVVCKILGEFFAVSGNTAYKVVYVNEIKVKFKPVNRSGKEVL